MNTPASGQSKMNDSIPQWRKRRAKPYTAIGIRRLRCIRCNSVAKYQWSICADGNNHRPLCATCDVALNLLVLKWMRHPEADRLVREYALQKTPDIENVPVEVIACK